MNVNEALIAHANTHKSLTPQDIIKFLYQGEFGCGHLIPDLGDAHERFCAEWLEANLCDEIFEPLGDGFCRINLGGAKAAGLPMYVVLRMFFASAGVVGSKDGLTEKLQNAVEIAKDGTLPVDYQTLKTEVEHYIKIGMPMLSHSAAYRNAYSPSYRVVKANYCTFIDAFKKIADTLLENTAPIIAIDGPAASGKTSFATLLSSIFPSNVIHADSFFLPKQLRNQSRLDEIGGNIHYERLQELLNQLPAQEPLEYKIFDCKTMEYSKQSGYIIPNLPVIVEGSYSMHQTLNSVYNLKFFIKTTSDEQKKRILNRNGKTMLKRFTDEWIPMENKYFIYNKTEDQCDLIFET